MTPLVSIVIPTYNRKQMAERLIKSILQSTYTNIEIIIIDDASTDKSNEYLLNRFSNKKNIHIFRNIKNLFAAGSRNEGFKKTKGEYTFFVDDDNVLDRHAIKELVDIFLNDDDVGEAGPVNYSMLNKKKILWSCTKRNMFTTKTNQSRSVSEFKNQDKWETDDIPNAYMVRSKIIRENNISFNAKYGIMYEESDYAYRIRKAGYKIIVGKKAKIYHDVESLSHDNKVKDYMFHFMQDPRRPFVFARNRILFHKQYSNGFQLVGVIFFWSWFFTAYYIYRIMFYTGTGNFSLKKRIYLSLQYLKGNLVGISNAYSI